MILAIRIALVALLLTATGVIAFTGWDLHQTQLEARLAIYNASAAAYSANSSIASLSGPCKDIQGDYICPPLTQLSQTEKNIGILAAKSAQQSQQIGTLVTATAKNLDTVGDSIRQVAGSLTGTATAATGALDAGKALLSTANDEKTGLPAIQGRATDVLADFETWERSQALAAIQTQFAETLTNLNAGSKSAAGILDSFDKMGKHIEKKVDTPKTKGQKVREWLPVGIKAGIQACASGFC